MSQHLAPGCPGARCCPPRLGACPPMDAGRSRRARNRCAEALNGGFVWVRFFGGIRVFGSARAVFWVRFVISRFSVTAVLPCSCGLAFPRRRTRSLRAARRPCGYITRRAYAGRRGEERTGKEGSPTRRGRLRDGGRGFEDSRGQGLDGERRWLRVLMTWASSSPSFCPAGGQLHPGLGGRLQSREGQVRRRRELFKADGACLLMVIAQVG